MPLKINQLVRLPQKNLEEVERLLRSLERHLKEIQLKAEAIQIAEMRKKLKGS